MKKKRGKKKIKKTGVNYLKISCTNRSKHVTEFKPMVTFAQYSRNATTDFEA